jgi:hypothetical protein
LVKPCHLFSHLPELYQDLPRCPPHDQELQTREAQRKDALFLFSSLTEGEGDECSWTFRGLVINIILFYNLYLFIVFTDLPINQV